MGLANAGLSLATLTVAAEEDTTLPEIVKAHMYLLMRRLLKYTDRTRIQGTFRVSVIDLDELFQVALISLWEASQSYNPETGAFEKYANVCISHALSDLREKSEMLNIHDSLVTDLIGDKDESLFQLEDTQSEVEYENAHMTLELLDFVRGLTTYQRRILHLLLCGYTQSETARHLRLDRRVVQKATLALKASVYKFAVAHDYTEWLKLFNTGDV